MMEAQGKKAISKTCYEINVPFFDALDANNDGHISLEEYTIRHKVSDAGWTVLEVGTDY